MPLGDPYGCRPRDLRSDSAVFYRWTNEPYNTRQETITQRTTSGHLLLFSLSGLVLRDRCPFILGVVTFFKTISYLQKFIVDTQQNYLESVFYWCWHWLPEHCSSTFFHQLCGRVFMYVFFFCGCERTERNNTKQRNPLVDQIGLEPMTSALSVQLSNQLIYWSI